MPPNDLVEVSSGCLCVPGFLFDALGESSQVFSLIKSFAGERSAMIYFSRLPGDIRKYEIFNGDQFRAVVFA